VDRARFAGRRYRAPPLRGRCVVPAGAVCAVARAVLCGAVPVPLSGARVICAGRKNAPPCERGVELRSGDREEVLLAKRQA
jgi:hypothetical protein